MPRRKQPKSLCAVSLGLIVDIIAAVCFRNGPKTEKKAKDDVQALSAFVQKIPPCYANRYMKRFLKVLSDEAIGLHRTVKEIYLIATLHTSCTKFKNIGLRSAKDLDIALLKNIHVMSRLHSFEVLECRGFSWDSNTQKIANDLIANNICHLRELTSITLNYECTFEILFNITENCLHLEKLSFCLSNYDNAILSLLTKCQVLKSLKWNVNILKTIDILYLLDNLPNLKYFYTKEFGRVLNEFKIRESKNTYGILSLEELPLPSNSLSNDDSLYQACSYFPALEEINLSSIKDYGPLITLTNLKKLMVYESSEYSNNFSNVILQCSQLTYLSFHKVSIKEIFQSEQEVTFPVLVSLALQNCKQVDINAVATQCPILKDLHYVGLISELLPLPISICNQPFHLLKSLHIGEEINPSHILFMLSSCLHLQHLFMADSGQQYYWMTNNLLNLVLQNNPMLQLQSLHIESDHITKDIIPIILQFFSELKELFLIGSQMDLTPSEDKDLKRQMKQFDVYYRIRW